MMVQSFISEQFIEAIDNCRKYCVDHVIECYLANPKEVSFTHDEFFSEVQHRFDALAIKAFVETVESDLVLTSREADLAKAIVEHLLKQPVKTSKLNRTFAQLSTIARSQSWGSVLEPVTWYDDSAQYHEEIKASILRITNIVAKVDGHVSNETVNQLKMIQWQLDQHLLPDRCSVEPDHACGEAEYAPSDIRSGDIRSEGELSQVLIQMIQDDPPNADESKATVAKPSATAAESLTEEQRETMMAEGMAELDALIGIEAVRHEVRTLVNLCKLQQARESHSMPTSQLSLHMVFTGNPGTGKTTVARIVGKLFGAMGILKRGHLIETDRSGLVAEYQGQTAKKTNERIDEALDGVLFIDEAYTLTPSQQADSYGQEAIGTLLKRMEDDRDRLVVILAGYPEPMDGMLKSNPGLSSRFSRYCDFPDYDTLELCQIFQLLADKNSYQLTDEFRESLRAHIQAHVDDKDEHFGNGRLVRNEFENAIRNLANRVVTATELTPDIVSTFHPSDIGLVLIT
ncbi:MAG: AAA family ATPase [Pirellulaceae bacterium]|nr:AAA family ATPase [Pirellulaceae bacterium]